MSYCRTSTRGSDVYVYRSDNGIVITLAHAVAFNKSLPQENVAHSPQEAIIALLQLKHLGVRVPKCAFDRLLDEV